MLFRKVIAICRKNHATRPGDMRLEKHMMRLAAQCKSDLVVLRMGASKLPLRSLSHIWDAIVSPT